MSSAQTATLALWKYLSEDRDLHVLIWKSTGLPYLEDPDVAAQESYCADGERESLLLAFTEEAGAVAFAQFLAEVDEEIRPSSFDIAIYTLKDLFELAPQLNGISHAEFGCPVRMDLGMRVADEILQDVIYSTYKPLN